MNSLQMLQVETTNICNAHCLFCPHHKFEEFGTISDELYEKIVTEASQLPKLDLFIPMLTGEPLCDKKFIERLKFARAKLPPWVTLQFYTNGSLLTNEIIDELKPITNLHISFSLNGMIPETRKLVMGIDDFWDVVKSMKYMESVGLPYRTTMVAYPEIKTKELQTFIEAGGMAIQYQSWCGEQYPYDRRRWTSCARALNAITVNYKGEVVLCCFDPFAKVVFGDLNNQTIEEIWKSEKHQELQSLHKQGRGNECPLCQSCTEG